MSEQTNSAFDMRPVNTEHPLFDAIWNAIKMWDIQRRIGAGYAGATGTDVQVIIDAITPLLSAPRGVSELLAKWHSLGLAGTYGGHAHLDVGGVELVLTYEEACIVEGIISRIRGDLAALAASATGTEDYSAGVKACVAWVEKRRHDFEAEYGVVDPSTNAMEFRSTAREEYDCELVEIEEGLRSLLHTPQASTATAPDGGVGEWKWVPVEPTDAMLAAQAGRIPNRRQLWDAMLAAAPHPATKGGEGS